MSNGEPQRWTSLVLEARHVPEEHDPSKPYPHDTNDPVTGFVDIGTMIDGVFVVMHRRKAPGLFADIQRAKDAGYKTKASGEQSQSESAAQIDALNERIAQLEAQQSQYEQSQYEQSQQPPQPPSE